MVVDTDRLAIEQKITGRLRDAGVWDPVGDARTLIERYLGPTSLVAAKTELERAVQERCSRLPLEHIVGSAVVDGASFVVGTGAFIPRTASLRVIELAADFATLPPDGALLDLCAGVGTIGIAVARRRLDAKIVMIERDIVPFGYLQRNVSRLLAPSNARVSAIQADLFEVDSTAFGPVDVVVANPPYVPTALSLPPEWSDHQPGEALYGGPDGLQIVRQVIRVASVVLKSGLGTIVIEHDRSQPAEIRALLESGPFDDIETFLDSESQTRITRARKV